MLPVIKPHVGHEVTLRPRPRPAQAPRTAATGMSTAPTTAPSAAPRIADLPLRVVGPEAFEEANRWRYRSMAQQLRAELDRLSAALAEAADGQQRQELMARRRQVEHQLAVVDALLAPPED